MKNSSEINFFDVEKNAKDYIEACEGMDGRFLIEILKKHLKPHSTILELGIGAGKDLSILNETFQVTGSDNSEAFLDIYKRKNRNADLIFLDAVDLETDRKFDCIYSNKVLHHLSRKNLKTSFERQKTLLNDEGILFHTFWHGEKEQIFRDLRFIQYKIDELRKIVQGNYEIIKVDTYREMVKNDSIYLILRKT